MERFTGALFSIQDAHRRDHEVRTILRKAFGVKMKTVLTKASRYSGRDGVHLPGLSID